MSTLHYSVRSDESQAWTPSRKLPTSFSPVSDQNSGEDIHSSDLDRRTVQDESRNAPGVLVPSQPKLVHLPEPYWSPGPREICILRTHYPPWERHYQTSPEAEEHFPLRETVPRAPSNRL